MRVTVPGAETSSVDIRNLVPETRYQFSIAAYTWEQELPFDQSTTVTTPGCKLTFLERGTQLSFLYRFAAWRAEQRGLWTDHCPIYYPSELNFLTKCSLVNWILTQFEALELISLLILRLWSLKFLEISDLGVKVESWELKNAESGSCKWPRGRKKGSFRATHTHTPFFQWVPLGFLKAKNKVMIGQRSQPKYYQ